MTNITEELARLIGVGEVCANEATVSLMVRDALRATHFPDAIALLNTMHGLLMQAEGALERFAEAPTKDMDEYMCHKGITTKEKCGRCSGHIQAYEALTALRDAGVGGE